MERDDMRPPRPAANEGAGEPSDTSTAPATPDEAEGPVEEAVLRLVRLAIGAVGLGLALASSVIRAPRPEPDEPADDGSPASGAELAARAAIGAGIEIQRRAIEGMVAARRTLAGASSLAMGMVPLPWWRDALRSRLTAWADRGAEERAADEALAAEVASDVFRRVTSVVLDRVDLDAVLDRIDVQAIVGRVDLNALVDRIDIERIVGRVDIDDLMSRIDLDRIVDRIDVEGIVGRLDLAGIAGEVMDELQVDEIIRESAGSLAVETVDAVRVRGVSADTFVSRLVDRLLGRKDGRELGLDHPADGDGLRSPSDG